MKNHRSRFKTPQPMASPSARNVAILVLLGSFLLITGITYYSIQTYFWYQQGMKPVPQTGGQQSTQTPIELPPPRTTSTPTSIIATQATFPTRTSRPTDTKRPPQPSPDSSATPTSTASTTASPISVTPGTITASPPPNETGEPSMTITPTPLPTGTPTSTLTPES